MNTIEAVVTRVLDVRPYRHFWIVEVEVLSWGQYSNTAIFRDSEKDARQVQPGDTVTIWGPQMNKEINSRPFWRNLVICCVLCSLLFWLPMGYLAFRVGSVMWEALWSLITTK
ncbi:hypothetical protein ACXEIW_001163 [Klebsiella oxytoca]